MGQSHLLERVLLSRRARGFTIIELMIVVVIVAVLASLAAPSFRSFMINQRVKTASFDLYSTLLFARSEAIKRPAGSLLITPINASNWADGWSVTFGTVVLRQQDAIRDISITGPASVRFTHDGRSSAAAAFGLKATGVSGVMERCIRASLSGSLSTKIQPASECS